ncbi:MAG TPA: SDR family oxidoreductase [Acidimicrobiales bacterium]|nr:SDR family oxidoreductase [Acidimicrobiales bacterium]
MTNTAIITGGSLGLGRALTEQLTRDGWHVVIDGRRPDALAEAAATTGATAVPGDVADPVHRRDLVEAARSTSGRLDLLVNNASTLGASPLPRLREIALEVVEHVYRVNAIAPLALIQEALPLLVGSGGAVLNVTSDAAVEAYAGWGGYGSSKAALEQLSNVLAVEEPQLTVWWVDPGDMRTQMHQDAFPGEDISDRPHPEVVVPALTALLRRRPPSGRVRAADLLAGARP